MSQNAKSDGLWYNFRTGQHDNGPVDGDYSHYVPQDQPAQAIYRIKIKQGSTPREAAIYVLGLYAKKMTFTNDVLLCPCDDECVCDGCTVTGAGNVKDDETVDSILCWQDAPPFDTSDFNADTWVMFPPDASPDDAAAIVRAVMGGDKKWLERFKAKLGG